MSSAGIHLELMIWRMRNKGLSEVKHTVRKKETTDMPGRTEDEMDQNIVIVNLREEAEGAEALSAEGVKSLSERLHESEERINRFREQGRKAELKKALLAYILEFDFFWYEGEGLELKSLCDSAEEWAGMRKQIYENTQIEEVKEQIRREEADE